MMKPTLLVLLTSLLLFPASVTEAGTIYDVVTDYSATVNTETSDWSYRSGLTADGRDGNYPLLPVAPGSGADSSITYTPLGTPMPVWNPNPTSTFPLVGKNETGVVQNAPAAFAWQPDDVIVHPSTGVYVVTSWLSPSAATIDISYRFTKAQNPDGGDGILWYVEVNDQATTLASGSLGGGVFETSGLLSANNISVNAGDRVNFVVESFGTLFRDTTKLEATIDATPIPEPACLMLVLVGASGLCSRRLLRSDLSRS